LLRKLCCAGLHGGVHAHVGCNGAAQDVGQLFGPDATNTTLAALRQQQAAQVDAIFTGEATKNPKSIAVT
jgi:hypothetical protein